MSGVKDNGMKHKTDASVALANDTDFAPANRSDIHHLQELNTLIESTPHVKVLIDAMPFAVLLLNKNRQIVSANQKVCSLLGIEIQDALGKRPGELIGCSHADHGPNGCGTGIYCKVCGGVNAILDSMNSGQKVTKECRIALHDGGALDWEVTASPLVIEGHSLICVGIQDISHQKRRSALERTFFHDIINQIGAIIGFIKLMADEYDESEELNEVITLTNELLEEVLSQRNLSLAENGDLTPNNECVELQSLLPRLGQLYQRHPVAKGKTVFVLAENAPEIQTDVQLLKRVLGNMIKNALEASSQDEIITVSCDCQADTADTVSIHVHNSAIIPQETQLQIFNRSFTTKKGTGRGIGTYSMKLIGEKYLNGRVEFESNTDIGTMFTITLPKKYESP
jgi:nitrogen-specific signal transduction histidine kinase